MKTTILTVTFLLMVLSSYGQAMLGATMVEVKTRFADPKHELETGKDEERDLDYYLVSTELSLAMFYFNKSGICIATFIFPDDQDALNTYVELYNEHYVIVDSSNWRMYNEVGVADIELLREDGEYYFLWTSQ